MTTTPTNPYAQPQSRATFRSRLKPFRNSPRRAPEGGFPAPPLGRATATYESRLRGGHRGDLVRLAVYLVAAALLGQWQAAQPSGRMALQNGVVAFAAPLVAASSAVGHRLRTTAIVLPKVNQLAAENRRLKAEIAEMQRRNASLDEAARERERLRTLLRMRSHVPGRPVAATVIGRRLSQWPKAIIINRGRADGVRPRQPVIAHGGLVGRIYSASAHTALAIPLTDWNSSAGAMIQRSRYAGILAGDGDACQLQYLPLQADVKPGDVVVSSGLGSIFPKGILIGTVSAVTRDNTASTKCARVEPSVDLTRLEEALVLRK